MKKSSVFWILLVIFVIILSINFLFHLVYFNTLHKNIRPASEVEKEKAIGILNQSLNLEEYKVIVKNTYTLHDKEIVQIDLLKDNSKKQYLIDLKKNKAIRR